MRYREKDKKNFMKVGIFLSLLTLVLMVMIISIGTENSIFDSKVILRARVDNVKNLKPGSYVELKGIKVGTVTEIKIISEDQVEIILSILATELQWIKQDSRVSISTAGLVGDKFLEIYNGTKSAPIIDPEKDFLISENLTDMKQLITKGESIATLTERVLGKLDTILYNMNDGKKLVEIIDSVQKASYNFEKISLEIREAKIGSTVKNVNETMVRLDRASGSVERIMTQVEKGPGTINSLIFDDGVHEDLRTLLGGASRNKVIKYFIRESIQNSERKKSKAN